jgi:hypothetical protein
VRSTIRTTRATHGHLAALAVSERLRVRGASRLASVTDLAQRLISRRLDPGAHPIASDRAVRLALTGAAVSLRRRDLARAHRLLYASWFAAAAVAPRPAVRWLGEQLLRTWRTGSLRGERPGL